MLVSRTVKYVLQFLLKGVQGQIKPTDVWEECSEGMVRHWESQKVEASGWFAMARISEFECLEGVWSEAGVYGGRVCETRES